MDAETFLKDLYVDFVVVDVLMSQILACPPLRLCPDDCMNPLHYGFGEPAFYLFMAHFWQSTRFLRF